MFHHGGPKQRNQRDTSQNIGAVKILNAPTIPTTVNPIEEGKHNESA